MCSINNIIHNNENCLIIKYEDLIVNPQNEIDKLFNYLNLKKEKIKLKNFNQFSFDGHQYNDSVLPKDIHTIRTNVIKKNNYDVYKYVPQNIINKIKYIK